MWDTFDFKKTSQKEWQQAAEKLLKGKPFKETLYTETDEDITVKPIYFENDSPEIRIPGISNNWLIAQTLFTSNKNFNPLAKDVLIKGQTALNINLDPQSQLGRKAHIQANNSLQVDDYSTLSNLLEGIDLGRVPVFFNAFNRADKIKDWLQKLCDDKNMGPLGIKAALGADPISSALIYGGFAEPIKDCLLKLIAAVKAQNTDIFTINTDIIHNSGGHKIHELKYALALIAAYVNHMMEQGIEPQITLSSIRIKMAVANEQFMEIAKLRAMRLLWDNICRAYKVENVNAKIDVLTSWRFLSDSDVHTNMLRTSGQAFSAIIGGCDSLDVLPFDLAINEPNEFSLRQARNLQIVLGEESNFNKVQDPAAGSNYLDTLTVELAQKSWLAFQEMEQQGGILIAVQSGSFKLI